MDKSHLLATTWEADAVTYERQRDDAQHKANRTGKPVPWCSLSGTTTSIFPLPSDHAWQPRTIAQIEDEVRRGKCRQRPPDKTAVGLVDAGDQHSNVDELFAELLAELKEVPVDVPVANPVTPQRCDPVAMTTEPERHGGAGVTPCVEEIAKPSAETWPRVAAGATPRAHRPEKFPVDDAVLVASYDATADLARVCRQVATPEDYWSERDALCRASVQLNLEGRVAPAFRPQINVDARKDDAIHMLMLRDQLVIDYHWCYENMDLVPDDASHAALFGSAKFCFCAAGKLAAKRWRGEFRGGEALGLSTLEQCQTLRLRGIELREREKAMTTGYRESNGKFSSKRSMVRRKIRDWTDRHPRMKSLRTEYENLWLARELLGPGNVALVPQLLAMMDGGAVRDRKTIRGKLATLDRHLGTGT